MAQHSYPTDDDQFAPTEADEQEFAAFCADRDAEAMADLDAFLDDMQAVYAEEAECELRADAFARDAA